jgi:uncharacterized protein (DUF2147 family)
MLEEKSISSFFIFVTVFFVSLFGAGNVVAQSSPIGSWRTIDDVTGKAKSTIRIAEKDGVLSGQIEKIFDPEPGWDGRCTKCRDHRKDQPVLGMIILNNMRKTGEEYSGGEILDPENGNIYSCRIRMVEDGRQLEVRGFIGISLFGRTQVWVREQ